jgi:hypothetical protein
VIRAASPRLSVVVATHEAADTLGACLRALRRSSLSRADWELIVVVDASTDASGGIAASQADLVVRLPGPVRGPAYARNRGFEAARGQIVVFVDPTVAVHRSALANLLNMFDARADVCALSGRLDLDPPAGGLVARYRSLVRRFEQFPGDTWSFWAGLGAIRADGFEESGRFDEWHHCRPSAEDAELGHRLRLQGRRVLVAPDVTGTCLEEPCLRTLLIDDVRRTVMPAARLALQLGLEQPAPRRGKSLVAGSMVAALVVALIASVALGDPWWLVAAAAALAGLIAADADLLGYMRQKRGLAFMMLALPLHVAVTASRVMGAFGGWLAHVLVGPPQVPLEVVTESTFVDGRWPPSPARPHTSVWTRPPGRPARRTPPERVPQPGSR